MSNPQTSQKRYWSVLKTILNKNIPSVIPPILHECLFVTDIKEKYILFNNYFKNQCRVLNTTSVLPPFAKTTDLFIDKIHIDPTSVLEHIRKLNVNKYHGHDAILAHILKLYDNTLITPLLIIYKNCITKGFFPKKWKKANVTPVH